MVLERSKLEDPFVVIEQLHFLNHKKFEEIDEGEGLYVFERGIKFMEKPRMKLKQMSNLKAVSVTF